MGNPSYSGPVDRMGRPVYVGSRIVIIALSGDWFDNLPSDEREDVQSMIGETFIIEEIDEYGHPWVRKSWYPADGDNCHSHAIALDAAEMEITEEGDGSQPSEHP